VVGAEIDGRTTPQDLGLDRLIRRGGHFIGCRSLALAPPPAWAGRQLVGLIGAPEGQEFPPGGHVVAKDLRNRPQPMLGPVTSWGWSPTLDRMIGLALLHDGRSCIGQSLFIDAPTSGACVPVTVSEPMFYDANGDRMRG
jgi:sarcosine oxidase, subunit alpha